MANFAAALGKLALEKSTETAKGFVGGAKSAFLSEIPAYTGAAAFAKTLREYSSTKEDPEAKQSVKEQKINNVISLEMVRQLRSMNMNIVNQTRFAAAAEKRAQAEIAFAEETEREKAFRDKQLLDAIKQINGGTSGVGTNKFGGPGGTIGGFLSEALKEGLFDKILAAVGATAIGKAILSRIPGRTPPTPTGPSTPQTSPSGKTPPGKVYDMKTGKPVPTPPNAPTGGAPSGGGGILKSLGSVARVLGWAALAIGAIVEIPGFIKDLKKWWDGPKWGGWDESDDKNKQQTPERKSMFAPGEKQPLSVRQNNPGAMRPVGANTGFQSYKTPQEGISALERQLYLYLTGKSRAAGYRKLDTIAKMISVYAPSNENATQNYINFVSEKTGIPPDKKLTPKNIPAIAKAITEMEGGKKAVQYFYGDYKGNEQRFPGAPSAATSGGGPPVAPVARSMSAIVPVSITDTGDETSRLLARTRTSGSENLTGYVGFAERERVAKKFYFDTAAIAKNTAKTAKAVEQQNKGLGIGTMRPVAGAARKADLDPLSRFYQQKTNTLTTQFENVTRRFLTTSLTNALFGGKIVGVSRKAADNPAFLFNRLNQELQFGKKLTPTMNRIFGKQYGSQYAQMFGQAGTLLAQKGVNYLGSLLPFQNDAFSFQQIVGNILTKGKGKQAAAQRKVGREQLIYSLTGIPTGATSGLALAQNLFPNIFGPLAGGYMTPQQQISGLVNTSMGILQPGMNFNTALGGAMGMIPGAPYGMNNMYRPGASYGVNNLYRPVSYDGNKMTAESAATMEAQKAFYGDTIDSQTKTQGGFFDSLGQTFTDGFKSLMSVFGFGGGPGGGSLMGGGAGGGGGFFDNLMSTAGTIGTMYIANKLFSKTGLGKSKNPLVQIAGNLAMNYLVKSGFQIAANALGFGDIAGKFLGANTGLADIGGSFLGTLTGSSTAGVTAASLGQLGINTSLAVGSTGGPASVLSGVTGAAPIVDAGSAYLAGSTAAGSTAALQAAQGTQAAAAFAEANAGIQGASSALGASEFLAAAAEAIPIVAAVYAVYRIINYYAFEKGDTRTTYSIYVNGNNDINAGEIVHIEKAGEGQIKMVENFGKAAFVMVKKIEAQAGVKPDFDYISVQISVKPHRNVQMGFNTGTPGKGDRKKTPLMVGPFDVRKPITATEIKVITDNMAKLVAERMSKSGAKTQSELESNLSTITKPEMAGDIAGLDKNVFKDTAGRTSYNEAIAAKAYEITRTEGASGEDPGYIVGTGDMSVFNAKTGQYQIVSGDSGILGYDAAGNPITSSTLSAAKNVISASPVASGSSLSYQQVQTQNDELKNSNPSTATTSNGGTAVVNSGNVNNNQNTVINNIGEGSSNRKYFGTVSPEFVPAFA